MSKVEFSKDKSGEDRWSIVDEDGVIHACHEGFSNRHNAVQNLFINHAMMSIFISGVARGEGGDASGIYFEEDADQKIRWKIKSKNGEVTGCAHKGFADMWEAMNNLIVIYTMLAVFVAETAADKAAEG